MSNFSFLRASFFLISLILFPLVSFSQETAPVKYWIFFADKQSESANKTVHIEITTSALNRRQLRGRPNLLDYDRAVSSDYLTVLATNGISPIVKSSWLNAVSAFLSDEQVLEIQNLPFVKKVQAVGQRIALLSAETTNEKADETQPPNLGIAITESYTPTAIDTSFYGPSFTQLNIINAIQPLEEGYNGTGVTLGFLDTKFFFEHPSFDTLVAAGRLDSVVNLTGQEQTNRHAMSVSSIALGYIPGTLIGPANGANVLAATTEYEPSETRQEEDFLVAGLEFMEAQGADVVNISLGYTTFDAGEGDYSYADLDGNTAITTIAADLAVAHGLVIVVAAGNEGNKNWRYVGTPADGDSVLSIGGVQSDSIRSAFSSFGPTADGRIKPDVSAMATSVYLATGDFSFASGSGTSFSSPMVAGVVCQILQANPNLNPIEIRDILQKTSSQRYSPDNSLGWGIINAGKAIEWAKVYVTSNDINPTNEAGFEFQTWPNPATSTLNIGLVNKIAEVSEISLYNLLGQKVKAVFSGYLSAGRHDFSLQNLHLASGIYFMQVKTGTATRQHKIIILN